MNANGEADKRGPVYNGSLKVLVRVCIRCTHLGVMVAVMLLVGCSSSRSADDESGSVTPIDPAVAESNPLRALNQRPAAPVLNTGNFPGTSLPPGSSTPPGAPRPPPSAAEFANAAAFGANMKIDLSAEERRVLLRLIRDAMDSTKHPLTPELKVLRDLTDKLRGEESPTGR